MNTSSAAMTAVTGLLPEYETKLNSQKIDIELREQSFKINSKLIIRPWLFKFLVGDTPKYLSYLNKY